MALPILPATWTMCAMDRPEPDPQEPDVQPLDVDGVRTVEVGTIAFLVGFVALLPFYGSLADDGRTWWLWTCLAGFGLGLFGIEYCRRRRSARRARDEADVPD